MKTVNKLLKIIDETFLRFVFLYYICTIINQQIYSIMKFTLYTNHQNKHQEFSMYQTMSINILNSLLKNTKVFTLANSEKSYNDVKEEIEMSKFEEAINSQIDSIQMENWGKWLKLSMQFTCTENQLKIISNNIGHLKLCIDEDKRIFMNHEFGLFTPKHGKNYGILNFQLYQQK